MSSLRVAVLRADTVEAAAEQVLANLAPSSYLTRPDMVEITIALGEQTHPVTSGQLEQAIRQAAQKKTPIPDLKALDVHLRWVYPSLDASFVVRL